MRTYKPVDPRLRHDRGRDRDRRMAIAARLRAEGLSLRQIATRQHVSYQTVARDLARWDQEGSSMPPAIIRLSRPAVTPAAPMGATNVTPIRDSGADVIPLRRLA